MFKYIKEVAIINQTMVKMFEHYNYFNNNQWQRISLFVDVGKL